MGAHLDPVECGQFDTPFFDRCQVRLMAHAESDIFVIGIRKGKIKHETLPWAHVMPDGDSEGNFDIACDVDEAKLLATDVGTANFRYDDHSLGET